MTKKITQLALIMEYFMKHPNRAIKHPEVVDWATKEYQKEQAKSFEIRIEQFANWQNKEN